MDESRAKRFEPQFFGKSDKISFQFWPEAVPPEMWGSHDGTIGHQVGKRELEFDQWCLWEKALNRISQLNDNPDFVVQYIPILLK